MGELLNKHTLIVGGIAGLALAAWGGWGASSGAPASMPERTVPSVAKKHYECASLDAKNGREIAIKGPTEVTVTKFDGAEWFYYFDRDRKELRYGVASVDISQPLPEGDYSLDGMMLKVSQRNSGKAVLRIVCEPPLPR